MPAARSGRVDLVLAVQAGFLGQVPEEILRQRAADDVTHADEENPSGLGHGGIITAAARASSTQTAASSNGSAWIPTARPAGDSTNSPGPPSTAEARTRASPMGPNRGESATLVNRPMGCRSSRTS